MRYALQKNVDNDKNLCFSDLISTTFKTFFTIHLFIIS